MRRLLALIFFYFSSLNGLNGNTIHDFAENINKASCRIEIIAGNNQFTREGFPFKSPLTVKITDDLQHPIPNQRVEFKIVTPQPDYPPLKLDKIEAYSDSTGIASVRIIEAKTAGDYEIMVQCPNRSNHTPQFFFLTVRRNNWVILLLVGLLGGLGLFLLGMNLMSEGLQNAAGNRMRIILSKLTNNRFAALGLGALITIIVQSSSATTVMLVSFVNSKLMKFRQTVGVILGAAVGTTITVQIIAFKVTEYALIFVAIGFAVQWLAKKQQIREIGKSILGFGMLFYGMYIMSESMAPLRSYEPFISVIVQLENPAIGIVIGALLTALIQSSSAFIGILIILSMQGLLTLSIAIPLIIGANLGTSITAILASLNGSRIGKQVAITHTIYKLVGAGIFIFFIPLFIKLVLFLSNDPALNIHAGADLIAQPRQIANAHTIYNIVLGSMFLPFTTSFARFIEWIFPERPELAEKPFRLRYIDENLLMAPSLALNVARMELVRMMTKVYHMTEKIIHAFIDKDQKVLIEIENSEKEINFLRDQINNYLIKITQNTVATENAEEAFNMMNAVREFEQIGDILSRPLSDKANSWCSNDYQFSEKGQHELVYYHEQTLSILIQAIKIYENPSLEQARKLKSLYDKYREEFFELERQHYDRLRENIEDTILSSKTHLEVITLLKEISSHATNTSRILIYKKNLHKNQQKNGAGKSSN